jgi:hypothetical protein
MGTPTNVQRRRTHAESAREKAERARLARAAARKRRRLLVVVGSSVGVLAVIGAIILAAALRGPSSSTGADGPQGDAPASLVSDVTSVPVSVTDAIGAGTSYTVWKKITDPPLGTDRPEVLYVGAEYCPFCAAERWAIVQALSRFGEFRGLSMTTSAAEEINPGTPSFTFHGATYTSDYLTFVGKEMYTNEKPVGSSLFERLDTLTAEEASIWRSHTDAFPFTDINGAFALSGASYDMKVLKGLTGVQIGRAMNDPQSPVAKAVIGAANVITAAICSTTGDQPANVCTGPGVVAAAETLPSS